MKTEDSAGYSTIARVDKSIAERRRLRIIEWPFLVVGACAGLMAIVAMVIVVQGLWPPKESRLPTGANATIQVN